MEISVTTDPTTTPVIRAVVPKVAGPESLGESGDLEWCLVIGNGAMVVS